MLTTIYDLTTHPCIHERWTHGIKRHFNEVTWMSGIKRHFNEVTWMLGIKRHFNEVTGIKVHNVYSWYPVRRNAPNRIEVSQVMQRITSN